eukprot:5698227-Amphidinium_carterae.1
MVRGLGFAVFRVVFEHDGRCSWCQEEAGTLHHLLFDCPAWDQARREHSFHYVAEYPPCLLYHGLVPAPRFAFPVWPEVHALDLPGSTLWVDGSGRAPNDSPFRVCSWSVVGRGVLLRSKLTSQGLLSPSTGRSCLLWSRRFKALNLAPWWFQIARVPAEWCNDFGMASSTLVDTATLNKDSFLFPGWAGK